ncbi:MAG: response regulator [Panacagrimonas sp.]
MSAAHAKRWRVALLEDDADMRAYFESCIKANAQLELSASFGTLAAAQDWFGAHTADVLLTDLALPDGHGLELIHSLSASQPACEILVVSVFGDEDSVIACIKAGALGYIHKDSTPDDIAQTIVDIKHGASPISPMIARKMLTHLRTPIPAAPKPGAMPLLSPRETEVLELMSRGYSYAEIARFKEVSIHTVQTHIKNLYGKLAVHSRSEAVFEASRMGLLSSFKSAG